MKLSIILVPPQNLTISAEVLQSWQPLRTGSIELILVLAERSGVEQLPWTRFVNRVVTPVADLTPSLAERYNLGAKAATGDYFWLQESLAAPAILPLLKTAIVPAGKKSWLNVLGRYQAGDSIMIERLTWQRLHGCNPLAANPVADLINRFQF